MFSSTGFLRNPLGPTKSQQLAMCVCVCVCLYFKDTLPLKQRCDLKILPRTIATEIKLNRNKDFIDLSYCHPNIPGSDFGEYLNLLGNI